MEYQRKWYYYVGLGAFGDLGLLRISWFKYWYYRLFTDYVVHRYDKEPDGIRIIEFE